MLEKTAETLKYVVDGVLGPAMRDSQTVSVSEKAGGEPVTGLDFEVEQRLASALKSYFPRAHIIGEEGRGHFQEIGRRNCDEGDVLLIDPLDGTANFIAGNSDFAVMLCYVRDGIPIAAWIYLPAHNRMALAERGGGTVINGSRVHVAQAPATMTEMVGEIHDRFLPETLRSDMAAARAELPPCNPRNCAGVTYMDIAEGRRHFTLYYRTRPWDHGPGTLICAEAGAAIGRFDGSPYTVFDGGEGLLVAPDPDSWRKLRDFLLPGYGR